jgi:serine/threonine-protein kinase
MQAPGLGHQVVYFIMEFLGGEALASLIQREAPLPPERAFGIAMQIADALAASHAKGIIHRDLKPDNIYLVPRGREKDFVKVLDFGIAKLTGDAPGSRRTRTGIVMGTPAYMSPEQCEGKGSIDSRTDIYALGILLYEMITGRVPFLGEGYGEVLVQHLTKRPDRPTTPLGAVPPLVEAVIMRSLEKRPDMRYQTMEELMSALRDPQGFIAAMGGLDAFYQPSEGGLAIGSGGAMTPGQSRTPVGMAAATPGLGVRVASTPGGSLAVDGAPLPVKKKTALYAVLGGAVIVLGIGLVVVLGAHKKAPAVTPAPVAEQQPAQRPTATPAVAAPVEPPAPVAPAKVVVNLVTTPPGAEVYFAAETSARGKTPYKLELPASTGEGKVTFKLDGYGTETRTIDLAHSSDIEALLTRLPPAPRPTATHHQRPASTKPAATRPATKPRPGGKDDTLAPSF